MPTNITDILKAEISESIGKIGSLIVQIPRSTLPADLSTLSEVGFEREDEGEIFHGYVAEIESKIDDTGAEISTLVIEGREIELQWENTYVGIELNNATPTEALNAILADTGWTGSIIGTGYVNITIRYDAISKWDALSNFALTQNAFVRLNRLNRTVEIRKVSASSGITIKSDVTLDIPNAFGMLSNIVVQRAPVKFNRIIPLGVAEGIVWYDLKKSNRTSPYTIQTLTPKSPALVDAKVVGVPQSAYPKLEQFFTSGANRIALLFSGNNTPTTSTQDLQHPSINGKMMNLIMNPSGTAGQAPGHLWFANAPLGICAFQMHVQNTGPQGIILSIKDAEINQTQLGIPADFNDDNPNYEATVLRTLESQRDMEWWSSEYPKDPEQIGDNIVTSHSFTVTTEPGDLVLNFFYFPFNYAGGSYLYNVNYGTQSPNVTPGSGQAQTVFINEYMRTPAIGEAYYNWWWASYRYATSTSMLCSYTFGPRSSVYHHVIVIKPFKHYYLEDAASVAAYKRRTFFLNQWDSKLVGSSAAVIQQSANTLYDLAVAQLQRAKGSPISYSLDVPYLPGSEWLISDSMIVDAPEYDLDNITLIVPSRKQIFNQSGIRTWKMTVSTIEAFERTFFDTVKELENKFRSISQQSQQG